MSTSRDAERRLRPVSILGTGSYVPEKILSNADLEKLVETSNDWIITRTGISERRIAGDKEFTSDMAAAAARSAMENAGVDAAAIDLIIIATVTPDMFFPSTACFVQQKIGATRAACMDLSAACSGFLFAIETARQFVATGTFNNILVVGADKISSIIDWTDRNTCVLFGDGAGAAIVGFRAELHGEITTVMGSDGRLTDILSLPGGGCRCPITPENYDQRLKTIKMSGKEVYKQAVVAMQNAAVEAVDRAGLTTDQIKCVIPHQANMRIIEAIADRLGIEMERFFVNLDKYGNTSAAAVAIALDEANRAGRFTRGDYILLVVFGGGLTWASSVFRW
jgi:3-oxoacyl-[acyl-carrier-protein] synthase-3